MSSDRVKQILFELYCVFTAWLELKYKQLEAVLCMQYFLLFVSWIYLFILCLFVLFTVTSHQLCIHYYFECKNSLVCMCF